jgi:hypothetical protein
MLYWSNVIANGLPQYDATYIVRVLPKGPKNNGVGNYWTTFFWGNNGSFTWGNPACGSFYGAHPYPFNGDTQATGQNWELAVNCNDIPDITPNGNRQVEWNRWHTQAFRAWRDTQSGSSRYCHEFYFDLPDTSKVIGWCSNWGDPYGTPPPNPALMMGQTANVNGLSWGGYPGWEEFKGVIRGIQVYSGLLSLNDILAEINGPKSTSAGSSRIWYLNLDPRPGDVTDKKGVGTPHNPSWDGTTAFEWSQ